MKKFFARMSFVLAIVLLLGSINIYVFADNTKLNKSDCAIDLYVNEVNKTAGAIVYNNTENNISGNFILSMYSDNGKVLENNIVLPMTIEAYSASKTVDYLFSSECTLVKAYFWDNFNNMKPAAYAAESVVEHLADNEAKLEGLVVENSVTSLEMSLVIDTTVEPTIRLFINNNYGYDNYEIGSTVVLKAGNTDIGSYLGYNVTVKVDIASNTVVEVKKDESKNEEVSFNLSQFGYYEAGSNCIGYLKNKTDKNHTKLKIQNQSYIIYNGIAYSGTIESMFGSYIGDDSGLIYQDNCLSGTVTLVDNDNISGYDIIFVNVAATAVVNSISSDGSLTFKNTVGERRYMNSIRKIEFNSQYTDSYIKLTRNNVSYDYKNLKEGDVLSIIGNNWDASGAYYVIEVINDLAVTGTVTDTHFSATSANGLAYVINGIQYDLDYGYYITGVLNIDSAGTFYINEYGKLAAYIADYQNVNYCYILDKQSLVNDVLDTDYLLNVIKKDGVIENYKLADQLTIDCPTKEFEDLTGTRGSVSIDCKDYSKDELDTAFASIVGMMSIIKLNNANEVYEIILEAYNGEPDPRLVLEAYDTENNSSYDSENRQIRVNGIRRYNVSDETIVFLIGKSTDSFGYKKPAGDNRLQNCFVMKGVNLPSFENAGVVCYGVNDEVDIGDTSIIVIYNTDIDPEAVATAKPTITPDLNNYFACVEEVSETTDDNGNLSYKVNYLSGGASNTSYIEKTAAGEYLNLDTVPGSLFDFVVVDDKIISAQPYLTFDKTVRNKIREGEDFTQAGLPNVNYININGKDSDEKVYYGAVVQNVGMRLTIAGADENGIISLNPDEWDTVSFSNYSANYYCFNPMLDNPKPKPGFLGDLTVDKQLANDGGYGFYTIEFGGVIREAPAFGMLDFIYARIYDHKADLMIYKSWEYYYNCTKN